MGTDIEDLIKYNDVHMETSFDDAFCITLFDELYAVVQQFTEDDTFEYMRNSVQNTTRKLFRKHKVQLSKVEMLYAYQCLVNSNKIEKNEVMKQFLMKKPANDISGINQVTILTSPTPDSQDFSCKHDCFYCPNEPALKAMIGHLSQEVICQKNRQFNVQTETSLNHDYKPTIA